jgi:broad specificity phosphatase PhoE
MLRVLLVRHGLTHDNVAGITQGHSQGSLTPLGRAQAAALVRRTTQHAVLWP